MAARAGVEELLAWYRDAGVDEPLADEPIDRFAASAERAANRQAEPPKPVPTVRLAKRPEAAPTAAGSKPVADLVVAATAVCAEAQDLSALEAAIRAFDPEPLGANARNVVFAAGEPGAKLLVVSDLPDRDEDAEGTPFAGAAGTMLARMLDAIDTELDATYRISASPWRMRRAGAAEVRVLAPFVARHIELATPSFVLTMGAVAARTALATDRPLPALRNAWHRIGADGPAVVATFHPNFLMAQPEQKRLAWADLLRLKERLYG